MTDRHPLSETHIRYEECTELELFALQSLHEERVRRSTETLEDIQSELARRIGATACIPLQRGMSLEDKAQEARTFEGPITC